VAEEDQVPWEESILKQVLNDLSKWKEQSPEEILNNVRNGFAQDCTVMIVCGTIREKVNAYYIKNVAMPNYILLGNKEAVRLEYECAVNKVAPTQVNLNEKHVISEIMGIKIVYVNVESMLELGFNNITRAMRR
jgi:hypothetical protein